MFSAKKLLSVFLGIGMMLSGAQPIAVHAQISGNAVIRDSVEYSDSIVLYVGNLSLPSPDKYFGSCHSSANESEFQNTMIDQPTASDIINNIVTLIIKGLKPSTTYICEVAVATPSGVNGHSISRQSDKIKITTTAIPTGFTSTSDFAAQCGTLGFYALDDDFIVELLDNATGKRSDRCVADSWKIMASSGTNLDEIIGSQTDGPQQVKFKRKKGGNINVMAIKNGERTDNNDIQLEKGNSYQENQSTNNGSTNTGSTPPLAGYEDEVRVNFTAKENPFTDNEIGSLEGKAAAELFFRGVIGGFPDGQFKGNRLTNRAESAKFFLLARGLTDIPEVRSSKFRDVIIGEWYARYIEKAAAMGIIEGHPDGSFRPGDNVQIEQFLAMMVRNFQLEKGLPYSYKDLEKASGDWFLEYVGIAQKYDLFPNSKEYFGAGRALTRNEVAVAIYQFLKNRNREGNALVPPSPASNTQGYYYNEKFGYKLLYPTPYTILYDRQNPDNNLSAGVEHGMSIKNPNSKNQNASFEIVILSSEALRPIGDIAFSTRLSGEKADVYSEDQKPCTYDNCLTSRKNYYVNHNNLTYIISFDTLDVNQEAYASILRSFTFTGSSNSTSGGALPRNATASFSCKNLNSGTAIPSDLFLSYQKILEELLKIKIYNLGSVCAVEGDDEQIVSYAYFSEQTMMEGVVHLEKQANGSYRILNSRSGTASCVRGDLGAPSLSSTGNSSVKLYCNLGGPGFDFDIGELSIPSFKYGVR